MTESYNEGDIEVITIDILTSHTSATGGIAGISSGTIANCYNKGNMVASETFTGENISAGGIVTFLL